MNLFLAGFSARGTIDLATGEAAMADLRGRLSLLADKSQASWRSPAGHCALIALSDPPERLGGVSYRAFEATRAAMFAGRPYRWTGEREAEGRGPLDPRLYLDPAERWAEGLDGRFAVVRADDRMLEVFSDRTGGYPVFETASQEVVWLSNNAELLRVIGGGAELSPAVLASLLGGGWSLSGHPAWAGIVRIAPGAIHGVSLTGRTQRAIGTEAPAAIGKGFDARRAAVTLTQATAALADWPGRPSVVPLTGGRDSRLVLAGALAARLDFETTTGGVDGAPDVEVARALAGAAGVRHTLIADDPHGSLEGDWPLAARLLALTAAGTVSLSDAAGFPFGPRAGALPLWHSGQGGEIARSYYGTGAGSSAEDLVEHLYRRFVGRRAGRSELLSADGREPVVAALASFVAEQLDRGVCAADVPDMFYLERRMGSWAGPTHGCVEYVRDTTSPLWSHRLLRDELGLPAHQRERELFHLRVLRELRPELCEIPFEDGRHLGEGDSELARRARRASAQDISRPGNRG
ncbi:MAG: hypothetical protein NVS2B6_08830 [Thermoleophilaceae bacterium]